mmetsp:Transcript_20175/g.44031  ORF Transcript_20175/g.44031 Transcript_20175/m.44031 type:complete len:377 (+) Transcript_20175:59-1189(+)
MALRLVAAARAAASSQAPLPPPPRLCRSLSHSCFGAAAGGSRCLSLSTSGLGHQERRSRRGSALHPGAIRHCASAPGATASTSSSSSSSSSSASSPSSSPSSSSTSASSTSSPPSSSSSSNNKNSNISNNNPYAPPPPPKPRVNPWLIWGSATAISISAGCYYYFVFSAKGPVIPLAEVCNKEDNPHVFLDIVIGGRQPFEGRIEIELFNSLCPRTVENFRCLCTGEKGVGQSGRELCFRGSKFHRIIPGFMCQGGDFTMGNGLGGESIYGSAFQDEFDNGYVKHSESMLLSMANKGEHTNGSQFFLTVAKTPHLDAKHVVFGRVVKGQDAVRQIEQAGSPSGNPRRPVMIVNCGQLPFRSLEESSESSEDKPSSN